MQFQGKKQRIGNKDAGSEIFITGKFCFHQLRLKVIKINARQRLRDVQVARLAIETNAVPVEHAICRVRVLLDLKNHQAIANGVDATTRQKHRVAGAHRNAMKTIGHATVGNFLLKLRARYATLETDIQTRVRLPHRRCTTFRFSAHRQVQRLCSRADGLAARVCRAHRGFCRAGENVRPPPVSRRPEFPAHGASMSQRRSFPASGPLAMTLASPGRSLISHDSPMTAPGGSFLP